MSAREQVLARIRSALGPSPAPVQVPRHYRTAGSGRREPAALLALLEDRLRDYRAGVRRATPAQLPAAIAAVRAAQPGGAPVVVVPPGLDPTWVPDATVDLPPLDVHQLDAADGVVTAATVAIAETGTLVLDGSPDQGRRAITLVPDLHICVVRADQVVDGVPDGLAALDPHRPLTFISGPSATSDIELSRVEGVHGPRRLEVILVVEP